MWENFKSFNRDAIITAVTHALAVVRSHYPAADLQAIGAGFAGGMGVTEHQQLEDEVEDMAKKLAATSTCSVRWRAMAKLDDLLGGKSVITGERS